MKKDRFRGHEIIEREGVWLYADTLEPVSQTWEQRGCGHCGLANTPEGHDGCLGTIPGALNACCGHGDPGDAYVQYEDRDVRGQEALEHIARIKREQSMSEDKMPGELKPAFIKRMSDPMAEFKTLEEIEDFDEVNMSLAVPYGDVRDDPDFEATGVLMCPPSNTFAWEERMKNSDLQKSCPRCKGTDIAMARDMIGTRRCKSCGLQAAPEKWEALHQQKQANPDAVISSFPDAEEYCAVLEEKEKTAFFEVRRVIEPLVHEGFRSGPSFRLDLTSEHATYGKRLNAVLDAIVSELKAQHWNAGWGRETHRNETSTWLEVRGKSL